MKKNSGCYKCKSDDVETVLQDFPHTFKDATIIVTDVQWRRCKSCGELTIVSTEVERVEQAVARVLVEKHVVAGDTFRFLFAVMGFKAKDVADLLDVTPVTISRWVSGDRPVDRAAWLLLAELFKKAPPERAAAMVDLRTRPKPGLVVQAKLVA